VIEDDAAFDDASPWASDADGLGASLHRTATTAFGRDAASWAAAAPSPGQVDLATGDATPPTVLDVAINHGGAQRSMVAHISVTFSEDVAAALDVADLSIVNLTAGGAMAPADIELAYDPVTHTATWTFPGLAGQTLADGNFVATLLASQITDAAGHALDGNGDRDVDFADLFQFRGRFQTALEPPVVEASGESTPLTSQSQPGVFNAVSEPTSAELMSGEPAPMELTSGEPAPAEASSPARSAGPRAAFSLLALATAPARITFNSPRFSAGSLIDPSPDNDDDDATVTRLRRTLQ